MTGSVRMEYFADAAEIVKLSYNETQFALDILSRRNECPPEYRGEVAEWLKAAVC